MIQIPILQTHYVAFDTVVLFGTLILCPDVINNTTVTLAQTFPEQ
jgi:hypothetical protein